MEKQILMVLLALCTILNLSEGVGAITSCKKRTDCSCQIEDGKVIGIAGLGKTEVKDLVNSVTYTMDPCNNFDIGSLKGVTVAQYLQNSHEYFDIGMDPNVDFSVDSGTVVLKIESGGKARSSTIKMVCSTGPPKLTFINQYPTGQFNFQVEGSLCCPRVPSSPSSSSSISLGSIITIAFFSILIVYVVCGVLFTVFVRKAQGKERVPNLAFWSALPGLIRDGFKFTFTCGKRSTTYNSI